MSKPKNSKYDKVHIVLATWYSGRDVVAVFDTRPAALSHRKKLEKENKNVEIVYKVRSYDVYIA